MLTTRPQIATSSSTEENSPLKSTRNINFKTPARSIKRGRAVHDENSVYGHPKTAGRTGRKKNHVLLSTPAVNIPLQSGLKSDKAPRFASKSKALAEITNQTPFTKTLVPVTPASLKPSKSFAILNDDSLVPSTRRISSTRKKLRLPRPASKSFETPETKGNYWDVSDASIEGSVVEDASITQEDYDDVEYAPPTAIEPKFDPGFDMPDYRKVGATLMSLFKQSTFFDDYHPVSDFESADLLEDMKFPVWEKLELPDILPDDIFPFMSQSESAQVLTAGAQVPKVETSHPQSAETGSAKLQKPDTTRIKPPSKPLTGKVTHTRIPSLAKPKVTPAATQATRLTLNSKATTSGHARTTSVPLRTTKPTHNRTSSVPSKNMGTTGSNATNMCSKIGISKPVTQFVSSIERKPAMRSQQIGVPDDVVLSLLTGFEENEPLGGEFLFKI